MIPHFIDCSSEEQFDFGLEMLVAGVAERAAANGP